MEEKRRPNERLRYERELRGWSQQTVADRVGTTEQVVSRWENGQHKPNRHFQTELCKLFEKSAKELGFMSQESEQRAPQEVIDGEVSSSLSSSPTQDMLETNSESEGNFMDRLRRELMKHGVQIVALAPLFPSTISRNLLSFSRQGSQSSFLDSVAEEQLVTTDKQPAALNEESIHAFQDIIRACWKFCDLGNIILAEQLLLAFLPQIQRLAETSKDVARLAAEGLRLLSVLSHHQLKLTEKLTQCLQSVKYAQLADEPNTLASSLHELTAALRYTHQSDALLPVFQEALSFSEQVVPPIRAGIYAGAAAAFAQRNRHKEADFYIHLAYETAAEETPHVLAAVDHGHAHLAEYEGLMYLEIDQPQKAFEVFERFTNALSGNSLPERNRLEMLNYQGQAALRLGDVEAYAHCLEKGIEGALAIQSKKRLDEALTLFAQEMPRQWLHEAYIKQRVERFRLSTGEA